MGKLVGKLWLPEYQQELSGGRLAVVFPAVGSQAIGVFSRDIFVAQMEKMKSGDARFWQGKSEETVRNKNEQKHIKLYLEHE